jgi:hypothetical protein
MRVPFHFLIGVLSLGLLLVLAACNPQVSEKKPTLTGGGWMSNSAQNNFVGNTACAPCHAKNFGSHQRTRHMQTLHDTMRSDLGENAPPTGMIPGEIKLGWLEEELVIITSEKDTGEEINVPLDLAFGSGKTGITYIALEPSGCLEMRQSYFPHNKQKWVVTPGQENLAATTVGQVHDLASTQRCIGCHSVTKPAGQLKPDRSFYGVGCESCHGAGARHVAAREAKTPFTREEIVVLREAGGEKINQVCGSCHRTAEDVSRMGASAKKSTGRFQPYGLSLSRCFKESKDKLSCTTCHNPHEDASTDQKEYEKTCLSCHSAPQKTCPVNPKEKCVSCHMPTRPLSPNPNFPIKMADHFIRVFKGGKPTR